MITQLGRCHGNQFGGEIVITHTKPSFVALAFRNGLEYRNANGCVFSSDDFSTSGKDLASLRPVTMKFETSRPMCTADVGQDSG